MRSEDSAVAVILTNERPQTNVLDTLEPASAFLCRCCSPASCCYDAATALLRRCYVIAYSAYTTYSMFTATTLLQETSASVRRFTPLLSRYSAHPSPLPCLPTLLPLTLPNAASAFSPPTHTPLGIFVQTMVLSPTPCQAPPPDPPSPALPPCPISPRPSRRRLCPLSSVKRYLGGKTMALVPPPRCPCPVPQPSVLTQPPCYRRRAFAHIT